MTNKAAGKLSSIKWFFAVPFIVAADQLSKWWVLGQLTLGDHLAVFPGLNIARAHNYGVAFGMFNDHEGAFKVVLLMVALIVTACIAMWLVKTPGSDRKTCAGLVLILGGALGNIIDRLVHGYVVDFIDVYFKNWHFWTFNIADSAITLGAILLIISILFEKKS